MSKAFINDSAFLSLESAEQKQGNAKFASTWVNGATLQAGNYDRIWDLIVSKEENLIGANLFGGKLHFNPKYL